MGSIPTPGAVHDEEWSQYVGLWSGENPIQNVRHQREIAERQEAARKEDQNRKAAAIAAGPAKRRV